jgi:hypothetical protein
MTVFWASRFAHLTRTVAPEVRLGARVRSRRAIRSITFGHSFHSCPTVVPLLSLSLLNEIKRKNRQKANKLLAFVVVLYLNVDYSKKNRKNEKYT